MGKTSIVSPFPSPAVQQSHDRGQQSGGTSALRLQRGGCGGRGVRQMGSAKGGERRFVVKPGLKVQESQGFWMVDIISAYDGYDGLIWIG